MEHPQRRHLELLVANAAHIKNVPGRKTDVNDATWIADLMARETMLKRSASRSTPTSPPATR